MQRQMNAEKMQFEVLACGDRSMLMRFCVDCGQLTGRFCDWCYAVDRDPKAEWAKGQHTPLCSTCDNKFDACHFCRGLHWCVPPPKGEAADE